jgi:acyl-coenzyme A thioesterase PaaI-like protein
VSADYAWVGDALSRSVPWVKTAGMRFLEVSADRAVLGLPDEPGVHNHVGGPHAAMIFGLGESASGAVVLAAFAEALGKATPLVVRAEIGYRKLALGPLIAEARLAPDAIDALAMLAAGQRPEFTVAVEIRDAEDVPVAQMSVVWTLRPHPG